MARKTIADLERTIQTLQPFQEAFFCLANSLEQHTLISGDWTVVAMGFERASGGVVIRVGDTNQAIFVSEFCQSVERNGDPYMREIASKLRRLQKLGVEKRVQKKDHAA